MLSIIKTAIITITLSFISGVLLDHYKNIAPRIICKMGKGKVIRLNNKKMKMYNLTIRNSSKQTIHNLNVNLHAHYEEMQVRDTEITRGLKFKVANENGGYDISIPFLSKNDEFSVKVFTECVQGNKPVVTLRSPEKFKRIDSNSNKNDKIDKVKNNKTQPGNTDVKKEKGSNKFIEVFEKIAENKKAVAAILTVLCLLFGVVLAKEYINNNKDKNVSTYVNKDKSNNESKNKEENKDSKNTSVNKSNSGSSSKAGSTVKNNNSSSSNSQNTTNNNTTSNSNEGTKSEDNSSTNSTENNNSNSSGNEGSKENNTENNSENNNTTGGESTSGGNENSDSSNTNSVTPETESK